MLGENAIPKKEGQKGRKRHIDMYRNRERNIERWLK
jgi:hypothetical protein